MAHLSLSLGRSLLVGAAGALMAAATPSFAQAGPSADGSWPTCSRTVTDNCMQREGGGHHATRVAHHRKAATHNRRTTHHKTTHRVAKRPAAATPATPARK